MYPSNLTPTIDFQTLNYSKKHREHGNRAFLNDMKYDYHGIEGHDLSPVLITIVSLILFLGFWCLVLTAISNLGGWAALAGRFPCTGSPTGQNFRFQAARFGWVDYNGCVSIRVCQDGLRIATMWPFRPGHPPMYLPWSQLHVVEVSDHWWGRFTTLEVGQPVITKIRLPLKVMDAAKQLTPS